jgi:hypothetical protein
LNTEFEFIKLNAIWITNQSAPRRALEPKTTRTIHDQSAFGLLCPAKNLIKVSDKPKVAIVATTGAVAVSVDKKPISLGASDLERRVQKAKPTTEAISELAIRRVEAFVALLPLVSTCLPATI